MNMTLRVFAVSCLVMALVENDARAAEGGYSNYIPGTYGETLARQPQNFGLTDLSTICRPCSKRPDGPIEGQKNASFVDRRMGAVPPIYSSRLSSSHSRVEMV